MKPKNPVFKKLISKTMAEKENKKKNWSIEAFQVVVCREKKLAPFLNVFDFEGITPEQKKMGRLFGAIQIFDHQEKSAYLPNLVAQVIKKEFFKETKRSSEESFESALRKANLALSDLASHEIISWIGKFNATVGAIQGDDFWFTQSGGGKIILVRKKIANEISLGLDNEESASHPMKTFSNISSGKLEKNDKIIFATETVFEKNRWEEFSRHITVFSSSELDNLLRSTIELEAENAGFVLANVLPTESSLVSQAILPETFSSPDLNFFGKKDKPQEKPVSPEPEKETLEEKPLQKADSESSPFEQEPELYIKENEKEPPVQETVAVTELEPEDEDSESEEFALPEKAPREPFPWKEKLAFWQHPQVQNGLSNLQTLSQTGLKAGLKKLDSMKNNVDFSSSKEKIARFFQKPDLPKEEEKVEETPRTDKPTLPSFVFSKKFWLWFFSLVGILALVLLFVFKGKDFFSSSSKELSQTEPAQEETPADPKENQLKEISVLPEKIVFSAFMKKRLYFLTENKAFYQLEDLDQKAPILKKIDLPGEIASVENIVGMNDLNLVFLITSKQVFAYSPVTGKIVPNDIENLPNNKNSSFSYLTYLYLLDSSANQISQYPRAGTGFGPKKDWLKESADLTGAVDFSADDSIFILFSDGKIARYFRGKKTGEFFVEKDGQKIVSQKIRTSTESEDLFLLSPEQKSVFQTDKTGQIKNQWESSQLENARTIEVDFASKTIFVTTQDQKVVEIKY